MDDPAPGVHGSEIHSAGGGEPLEPTHEGFDIGRRNVPETQNRPAVFREKADADVLFVFAIPAGKLVAVGVVDDATDQTQNTLVGHSDAHRFLLVQGSIILKKT